MKLQQFSPSVGNEAERLAYNLLFGPEAPYRLGTVPQMPPFGVNYSILGVGVIDVDGEDEIAVFVNTNTTTLKEAERLPILEVEPVRDALQAVFGDGFKEWAYCYAIGVLAPELHISPGDLLNATQGGTCGASVTWGNHRNGVLTAGHVASNRGASVTDVAGHPVGVVAASWDPTRGQAGADVAVIELGQAAKIGGMRFGGLANITCRTNIEIYANRVTHKAQVISKTGWFYFPSTNGTYIDIYMTSQGVTIKGDSGSAAALAGTGKLAGHVIGGTGAYSSFVQDIQYQLSTIGSAPGFANVSI